MCYYVGTNTKKMTTTKNSTGENRQLAEKVYNKIMSDIDTDLLLENIPTLDQKYVNETEAEHAARMARYKKSYKKFDEEMKNFLADVRGRSRQTKRAALYKEEKSDRVDDINTLENLEMQFQ